MKRALLTLSLGTVGTVGIANALVSFTTFTPTDGYAGGGYSISGPNSGGPQIIAMQFTAGIGGVLDSIRFASFYGGGSNQLTMTLHNDNGSDQLGAFVFSWNLVDSDPNPHISTIVNPNTAVTLTFGQKYWLKLNTVTNGNHAWSIADPSIPHGRFGWSNNNGSSYNYTVGAQSAFEVNVVPEPATMAVLGLGLAAVGLRRRKRS